MSSTPDTPRRALIFWTVTLLIGVDTVLFSMVAPALPDFAERYDFSASVAALIFAVFPVGQLLAALIAAGWVERWGRRPVMMVAAVVLLAATLGFAAATGPELLALARFMQGAAGGLVWTAGLAAISDVYPVDQLGFRLGLAETAGGAMGLLGPILGGALIVLVGLDATFALAAILPALALIPVFLIPETRRALGSPQRLAPAVRSLVRVPKARVAFGALAGVAAVLALVEPLLPLDLSDRLNMSSLGIGIVFAVGLVSYFALVPVGGRWSDRRGRRTPLVVGGVLMAAGLPFLAVGSAVSVAIAFAVVGAGMAAMGAPSGPLMVEAVDEAGMAGQYGLSAAMLTVVFAVGYAVGPLLGAATSAVMPFLATMILAAVCIALVTVWVVRTLPRGQRAKEALAAGPRG